ncbi:MAG: LamG-like jellyroll fold domain-containing protein, partial [Ignavibacteriaceae bacterium]
SGNIAYDESSYQNHGTIYGNQPSEGKFFGGRTFPDNNTDLGITLPYTPSLDFVGGDPITMEAWIKTDIYFQGATPIIRLDEYGLFLGSLGSKGHLQFNRRDGNNWNICQVNNLIPLNEWVHVMATYDGNNTKMYINGIEQEYTVFINPYNQVDIIRIASFKGSIVQVNANVLIDEVRISNVAREFQPPSTYTIVVEELDSLPVNMNFFYTAYNTVNNNLYLFGGRDPGDHVVQAHDWIWKYNLAANSWEELTTTLPYEVGYRVTATYYDGHFYMGPGFTTGTSNGWGVNNKIIDVDLINGVGAEINAFPYSKIWGMSSIEVNGKIYFFGGHNGADQTAIFMYDPTSSLLSKVADMIDPKPDVNLVLCNDGWIYYFVGDSYSRSKRFERFNPQTGNVDLLNASLPYTGRSYVSYTWYVPGENAIYFFNSEVDNPVIYKYDISNDEIINTGMDIPGKFAYEPAVKDANDPYSIYAFKLNPDPTTYYPYILTKLTLDDGGGQTGPVAYYPFNGNANDESGNGWNCDVFGATLTDDRFGNFGYAYEFDGVNDYIFTQNELDWESLGLHNTMSISVWIEPYSLGLGNYQYSPGWALNNRDLDNVTYWTVGFGGNHTFDQKGAFTVFNDNYQSNSILEFNQWYHLVAVLENASTVKIYINGILENSYSITTPPQGTLAKLTIGKNGQINGGHNSYLWDGKIDD